MTRLWSACGCSWRAKWPWHPDPALPRSMSAMRKRSTWGSCRRNGVKEDGMTTRSVQCRCAPSAMVVSGGGVCAGTPKVATNQKGLLKGDGNCKGAASGSRGGGKAEGQGQKGVKEETRARRSHPGHIAANCADRGHRTSCATTWAKDCRGAFRSPLSSRRRRSWEASVFWGRTPSHDYKCFQTGAAAARAAGSREVKFVASTATRGPSEGYSLTHLRRDPEIDRMDLGASRLRWVKVVVPAEDRGELAGGPKHPSGRR